MSRPDIRHNTFFQKKKYSIYDTITKNYFRFAIVIGIDRLSNSEDFKAIHKCIIRLYVIVFNITIMFILIYIKGEHDIPSYTHFIEHAICAFLTILLQERLRLYFLELKKFDETMNIKSLVITRQNKITICGFAVMTALVIGFYCIPFGEYPIVDLLTLPIYLGRMLELLFYGHLMNLICQRIKLINTHLETSSFSNANFKHEILDLTKAKNTEHFKLYKNYRYEIKKLIDVYRIIVRAISILNRSIKWQVSEDGNDSKWLVLNTELRA